MAGSSYPREVSEGHSDFQSFLFDVLFSLSIFSFILYSDFCQILIDFHGQITGNDDPNEFLAEITQNNRKITVNCL